MKRLASFGVFLFLFVDSLFCASIQLKVFPTQSTVKLGGHELKAYKVFENVKTYDVPAGNQNLELSCEGWESKTLSVSVPSDKVWEEKLEPKSSKIRFFGELKTGVQPKSVAFTPDGQYLIVPLLADDGIDVFRLNPFEYVKRISPTGYARKQGFVESGYLTPLNEIWISQMTTGKIHIFDAKTFEYKETVSSGGDWSKVIAFSPDGKLALVSNWESNSVTVIDTAQRKLLGKAKTSGIPRGLAFTQDGKSFVAAIFDNGKVEKFRLSDFSKTGGWDFGSQGAMRHAVSAFGRYYFSDMARGLAFDVDATTEKLRATISLGYNINTIALTPDGKTLFASSRGKNNPVDYTKKGPEYGKVFWVNTETDRVEGYVFGRNQPTGLAVSPDGKWLALTDFLDNNLELYRIVASSDKAD